MGGGDESALHEKHETSRGLHFREEIMGDKVRHLGLTAAPLCAVAGLTATTADAGGAVTTSLFLSLSGAVFI